MKVAVVVNGFPILSETFILNQITGLRDLGHEVDIHAFWKDEARHADVEEYNLLERCRSSHMPTRRGRRLLRAARILMQAPTSERRLLLRTLDPRRFGADAWSLKLFYRTLTLLGESYDVLHCHFGPNGNLAAHARELGVVTCPIVTTFHGYDLRYGMEHGGAVYEALQRQGARFLAVSSWSRDRLEELGFDPERLTEHRVGIDLDRFPCRWCDPTSRRDTSGTLDILSVGRLVPEKAFSVAIRAVEKVVRRNPSLDVRYTILGGGPERDALQSLVGDLGMSERIILAGAAPRAEVVRRMRQADVFLLSSVAEVLPVVLIEAQAIGLPVVATRVGAVDEVVEHGTSGFLVPPEDADAMADAVEGLARSRDEHRAMGLEGRAIVEERHDIDVLNRRLVDLFEELRETA